MAWRVARSLKTLLDQLNAATPRRSKVSDGSIGDTAHQASTSDHNPWWPPPAGGIVTAIDITHDPAGGLDCHRLADDLVRSRDPRIKYIIWNRRILDTRPGFAPWVWREYHGTNPHNHHLHLSVVANSLCEDPSRWSLSMFTTPQTQEATVSGPWRLDRTPLPAGKALGDRAAPGWPGTEDVITLPGPVGGWKGQEVCHVTFGAGGAWIEEAWFGPGQARHVVTRWDPTTNKGGLYAAAFVPLTWVGQAGERFLTLRYACPAGGSVGIETQH
jgi:hypothetical protein